VRIGGVSDLLEKTKKKKGGRENIKHKREEEKKRKRPALVMRIRWKEAQAGRGWRETLGVSGGRFC